VRVVSSGDTPDLSRQAAYHAVVSTDAEQGEVSGRELDERLIRAAREHRDDLKRDLSMCALERFGPAYTARIDRITSAAGLRLVILLLVHHPIRVTAATVRKFRLFAGDIEAVIAESLEQAVFGDDGGAPADGLAARIGAWWRRRRPGAVEVKAELDEASLPGSATTSEEKTPWDRIAAVLAAVGTGIGVLGFVTFVGGAIEMGRFHAAGLPEEAALSVVPASDLVVVGAVALVPAIVIGLLACAFFLFFGHVGHEREKRTRDPNRRRWPERHPAVTRAIAVAVLVIAFELVSAVFAFSDITLRAGPFAYVVAAVAGIVIAALATTVALRSGGLLSLATTLFVSLSLFLVLMEFIHAYTTPMLRGAAVVRQNDTAMIGYFISENSDRVYLARLDTQPLAHDEIRTETARLIGIDKDQISDLAVGPPKTELRDALIQARRLAAELCALEPQARQAHSGGVPRGMEACWSGPRRAVLVPSDSSHAIASG
jgi:hypothetical protein